MEKKGKFKLAISGILTGVCNGLWGAGGGVIAVITLRHLCGIDEEKAHATAISIMLPLTVVSAGIYVFRSAVDWRLLCWVAPAFFLGGILGAKLTGKIGSVWLERVFALIILIAGVWMVL